MLLTIGMLQKLSVVMNLKGLQFQKIMGFWQAFRILGKNGQSFNCLLLEKWTSKA
jgi:hypothetical protein